MSDMSNESLETHRGLLEEWSEQLLRPYLRRLKRHDAPYGAAKEFNDAVWATLQLRADEVVLLDSPLLQRLRRIKQLGVVHYVYPAATHSRLEHSLGTVHQVQQLISSINEHGYPGDPHANPFKAQNERLLRLAALCHDVGHGAMSHVSEYALDDDRSCQDIRLEFQRSHDKASPNQLSEIAAFYIIGSPAFSELLREIQRLCNPIRVDDLQNKMQRIIIGSAVDRRFILLHELVSGPFDADKLDYLARDAWMCGVPVVADVPRLVQKVRATEVDRERLPKKLRAYAQDTPAGYVVTGIARSGARTLDELSVARTLMFDKIYRHQKVRSAEAMVFSLLTQLKSIAPGPPAMLPYLLADDEILSLTQDRICVFAGIPYSQMDPAQRAATDAVAYLATRLRDRRLFSRAFAFAANMPRDDYRLDPEQKAGLQRLIADSGRRDARIELVNDIADRARTICELTNRADRYEVAGGELAPYVWISAPTPPPRSSSLETGHAYLIDESGSIIQSEEETADAPGWADAYVATRDLGYVFSLKRLVPVIYLAAEAMVRERYGVRIPETMLTYAKQDKEQLDRMRRQLEARGWYDDHALDIRPLPAVLTRSDTVDRADGVVEKLRGYSGPYQDPGPDQRIPTSTVNRQQILAFVRQFGDDDLVDAALTVLSHIRILGRPDACEALRSFVSAYPEFQGASYCTLGDPRDSSSLLTYYVGDVADDCGLTQRSLIDALSHDTPIIFIDDLIGRGSQSISILENWLGLNPTQHLGERRSATLAPPHATALQDRRLAFVFGAGMTAGESALQDRLAELTFPDPVVYVDIREEKLPFLDDVLRDPPLREKFKKFAADAVQPLLLDPARGHDADWATQRLLGYGNRGLLLASTYNTPSATLTCLWKENPTKSPWRALLRRRTKR